jgi:hypothetical protein
MNDAGRSDEPVSGIDAIDRPLPFTLLKVKSELNERLALAACAAPVGTTPARRSAEFSDCW